MYTMKSHSVYLAIIALLIIIIVFASAKSVRAHKIMTDIETQFGIHDKLRSSLHRKDGKYLRKLTNAELLKPRTFIQYRQEIDDLILSAQNLEEFGKQTLLSEACGKALLGGKRIRSIILLEIARATSLSKLKDHKLKKSEEILPSPIDAGEIALFIEYLHSASIIIDDMPAFDNDLVRRNRPSLHADMGSAVAQMAALSLVASGFQNICRQLDWIRDNCPEIKNVDKIGTRICSDVSRALGSMGAAGGQYMDISPLDNLLKEHGPDAITDLMYLKTATFFEIAVVAGWLSAGGHPDKTLEMRNIGQHIGTAFQIADDIGDMKSDAERAANGKSGWNFANMYGREEALREVELNLKIAKIILQRNDLWTLLWESELYPAIRNMAIAQ